MTALIRHYGTVLKLTFLVSESDSESDSISCRSCPYGKGRHLRFALLCFR